HPGEDKQVEEVHAAQSQEHPTQFVAEHFNGPSPGRDLRRGLKSQGDEADVDQVEPNHQQVIDCGGQGFIAVEGVHQEDGSAFVQRARHPDGQIHADEYVKDVGNDDDSVIRHKSSFYKLNTFKIIHLPLLVKKNVEHVHAGRGPAS